MHQYKKQKRNLKANSSDWLCNFVIFEPSVQTENVCAIGLIRSTNLTMICYIAAIISYTGTLNCFHIMF